MSSNQQLLVDLRDKTCQENDNKMDNDIISVEKSLEEKKEKRKIDEKRKKKW